MSCDIWEKLGDFCSVVLSATIFLNNVFGVKESCLFKIKQIEMFIFVCFYLVECELR